MSKRFIVLFAAVAFAALAAGCGSSSDDSSDTAALTKAEFVKQGDAICEKGSEQLEDEAEAFADDHNVDTKKPTDQQQEEVIETVVAPALQKQAEEIGELGAPSGEEERVTALLDALEGGVEELESDPASLLESKGAGPLDKANELASEFGFKTCGQ